MKLTRLFAFAVSSVVMLSACGSHEHHHDHDHWVPESPNAERLHALQQIIKDKNKIRELVEAVYEKEVGL